MLNWKKNLQSSLVFIGKMSFLLILFSIFSINTISNNVNRVKFLHRVNRGGPVQDLKNYLTLFGVMNEKAYLSDEEDVLMCGYILYHVKEFGAVSDIGSPDIFKNTSRCNYLIAEKFKEQGRIDKAITYYEDVVDQNPKHFLALKSLGDLYYRQDQFQKAIIYYKSLLSYEYEYKASDYFRISQTYRQLGKIENAMLIISEAKRIYPDNPWIAHEYANFLLEENKNEEAIHFMENFTQKNEGMPESHYVLCRTLYDVGAFEEALAACKKAISVDHQYARAIYWASKIYLEMGDVNKALDYALDAAEIEDSSGTRVEMLAFVNLGDIYNQLGRRDMSIDAYCHALSLEQWLSHREYIHKQLSKMDSKCD